MIIPYRFRSLVDADLPMLERWLKTPEVARWWGDPAEQLVLLKEDLNDPLMRQWIVAYGQRPFAYVQAYEAHAWPQVHLQSLPGGTQVITVRSEGGGGLSMQITTPRDDYKQRQQMRKLGRVQRQTPWGIPSCMAYTSNP